MDLTFSEVLKKWREDLYQSQAEFAKTLGVSKSYVSLLERGKRLPPCDKEAKFWKGVYSVLKEYEAGSIWLAAFGERDFGASYKIEPVDANCRKDKASSATWVRRRGRRMQVA